MGIIIEPWSVWKVWELIVNAIEIFFIYYLFVRVLGKNYEHKRWPIIGAVCLFIYVSFFNSIESIDGKTMTIISSIGIFLYALTAFKSHIFKKILFGIIPAAIIIIADFLTFSVSNALTVFDPDHVWNPSLQRSIMMLIYLAFTLVLYTVVCIVYSKMKNLTVYSTPVMIYVIVLIGLAIFVINYLIDIAVVLIDTDAAQFINSHVIFIGIVFLVLLVGFTVFLRQWALLLNNNHEIAIQAQQKRLDSKYYQQIHSEMKKLEYAQHDFLNHMQVVKLLVSSHEYDKAVDYLSKLDGDYRSRKEITEYTCDTMLNAILSNKRDLSLDRNIKIRLSVQGITRLPLLSNDICSLIGNLLDNAIEACSKEKSERFIDIFIFLKENAFHIIIKNSFSGPIIFTDGEYRSTKDKAGHGNGLKIVKSIVESVKGKMIQDYDKKERIFTITISIPMVYGVESC